MRKISAEGEIGTSELESSELEGGESVRHLDDVDECVEVVGGHDEAVALSGRPPAPQQQVATQAVLQRARQVLVEDRVQVVIVST